METSDFKDIAQEYQPATPESLSSGAKQYSKENFYSGDLVILKNHLVIHIYRPCFVIIGVKLSPTVLEGFRHLC